MKKNRILYTVLVGLLMNTGAAFAQSGLGTNNPDASSVLEMKSNKRGLLIPRMDLSATNVAAPVNNPANSLLVYNEATAGTGATKVTPGFYYWSAGKWNRVVNEADVVAIATANDSDTTVNAFGISASDGLKLTFSDGTSKSVSIAALKTAIDTNTQSRETVVAGDGIEVSATAGTDNKAFTVKVKPADAADKVLMTVSDGASGYKTEWKDAPSSGPNFGNGTIRSVPHITASEWDNNQFALIQTGTNSIELPPANATNKYRIIAVHCDNGSPINYASPAPNRNSSVAPGKGQLLMCDGAKWFVIGGL